jgi:hypothetical protein
MFFYIDESGQTGLNLFDKAPINSHGIQNFRITYTL